MERRKGSGGGGGGRGEGRECKGRRRVELSRQREKKRKQIIGREGWEEKVNNKVEIRNVRTSSEIVDSQRKFIQKMQISE